MSSTAMPGSFLSSSGKVMRQLAVGPALRTGAEVDEVVPVERGEQERGRHAELAEDLVGLALGVEVRHLVLAHAASASGRRSSGTQLRVSSSVDQITCCTPAALAAWAMVAGLGQLLLGREVLPEVGDAEGAVRAGERALRGSPGRRGRRSTTSAPAAASAWAFSESGVPGDRADGEPAVPVGQDRANQPAALRAGGADDRDDLLLGHDDSPK